MSEHRSASESNAILKFVGVLSNKCPRCFEGAVWRTLLSMHHDCSRCGYRYLREPGYFTSAFPIAYGLALAVVGPTFLVIAMQRLPVWQTIAVPIAMLVVLSPFVVRLSRLVLLHTDERPFDE